jgi:transposase
MVVRTLAFMVLRQVLSLVGLGSSPDSKDIEIAVLRHQLLVLRRQVARPRYTPADRMALATLAKLLPRDRWPTFLVTPSTLLRWHRELARRRWTYPTRGRRRRGLDPEVVDLVLRLARENPRWGYLRTVGECRKLGVRVSATSVRTILRRHRLRPAPRRGGPSWAQFLRSQAAGALACDFLTVETIGLTRLYVFFVIELDHRSPSRHGIYSWTSTSAAGLRFLLRDRDTKFTPVFDAVFHGRWHRRDQDSAAGTPGELVRGAVGGHRTPGARRADAHRRRVSSGGGPEGVRGPLQRPPSTSLARTAATESCTAHRGPECRPDSPATDPGRADQRVLAGSVAEPALRAPQVTDSRGLTYQISRLTQSPLTDRDE